MIDPDLFALLQGLEGRTITGLRRIHYVKPGGGFSDAGPFEVTFSDGLVVLMDVGPDGEELRLSTAPWRDPFAEPLSGENRAYVNRVGKWTAFDVGSQAGYANLRDQTVITAEPQEARAGSWGRCNSASRQRSQRFKSRGTS